MSDWVVAIILGIVEGVTEFIPVSSTGHLLIAEHWLPRQSDLFNIVIQSGAVLAVLPLFPQRLRQLLNAWRDAAGLDYLLKLGAAFLLTGVGGIVLSKAGFKLPESLRPVAISLLAGGVLFLVIERRNAGRVGDARITWTIAVAVGIAQLVAAVFPGASRSGATILAMLLLGASRPAATEFSFLVGIPTLLAAGALKIFDHLSNSTPTSAPENWQLVAIGFVASALVSFVVVKWMLRYVETHSFVLFGWYRIALGAGLLAWSLGVGS
ncbi:MAG: undecaprenyl-diphosphate phosphatase [Planctomycetota bacterium]